VSASPIAVREAVPADAAGIATCHVRSWQVAYRGQLPDAMLDGLTAEIPRRTDGWARILATEDRRRRLVAVDGEHIAGFVAFGPNEAGLNESVGEVYAIYLDPAYWGRGVGRALMDAAVEGLRRDGLTSAVLWVLETNERAKRFYRIAGWRPDGARKTEHRGDVELREERYRRDLSART
jgi:ribosomal protein S18 acetylase RimI-like enzyme